MAVTRYKVMIAEIDGTELLFNEELPLDADRIFFNDTGAPFTEDNLNAAVTQAANIGSAAIYTLQLEHNGSVGNNTYIGSSSTVNGLDTPIPVTQTSSFVSFSFSNKRSNADYTLEFYKNSPTGTPFYTVSQTNTQFFSQQLPTAESFAAGDLIYVKYIDNGQNANDVFMALNFKVVI